MGLRTWLARNILRIGPAQMAALQVDDYGHADNLSVASTKNGAADVGYDQPTHRAYDAGDAAEWPDPVYEVNTTGHHLLRITPPVIIGMRKAGNRIVKVDWTVQGGNATRREQFKYMIDHTPGWAAMLRWLTWAIADGMRIVQIKTLDKRLNPSRWTLPDLRGGGRLKLRAGGMLHWDGVNLYVARTSTGLLLKEPQIVTARDQFMVHRPEADSSPNGSGDIGLSLYNLAESWWEGFQADKVYKKRYNHEIYSTGRRAKAPNVQAGYARAAQNLVKMDEAGYEGLMIVSDQDAVKLRELRPNGLQDLWHGVDKLAGLIYLMLLASKITADASDQNGVGSSGVGLSEELAAALAIAGDCAETINSDLVPWYATRNAEMLEPLGEDEEECYVVPQAPKVGDQGDMDTGKQDADDPDDLGEVDEGDSEDTASDGKQKPGTPPATANLIAGFARHMATLAKPSAMVLPPVHPHCRCVISEDAAGNAVWLDARDNAVCAQCRAYGAVFNALERANVKLTEDEADAIQDARDSKKFKKALEYDDATRQAAIDEAAAADKGGIIEQATKQRGITPSPDELQDAIEAALDASRKAAEVQAGTTIGTGPTAFTVPEAVIGPRISFGSDPNRMFIRPQYVNAVISSGGNYNLVYGMRQGGMRAQVVSKTGGRTIASSSNLWWILLLFAEMERREINKREQRRRDRELAGRGNA